MPRPRTPTAKAEVSGASLLHPGRFSGRKSPKRKRPVGEPYAKMSSVEKEYWDEYRSELPWLNSSHRQLLRLACMWTAKMDEGDFGVSATQALSSILSKLGATPADESKINHDDSDEEDPADKFFGRPN